MSEPATERCEFCGSSGHTTDEHEMVELSPPAYYVEMVSGMPDLLFEDYAGAYENATGEGYGDYTEHEDDEHPEEWRIHLVDSDGPMEVPVVDI